MAYGDFKDLPRRTASDKILYDKAFNIAKNPKYDRYQRGLTSMVYKFFDKNTSGGAIKNENMSNKELAEELYKPILIFIDNILSVDLSHPQLVSKFNKGIRFLFCVIDIFSKYAWVIPLKVITITNTFQKDFKESNRKPNRIWVDKSSEKIFKESNRKPNRIWVDKGSEFYNRSMKPFLQNNNIDLYLTYNEGKSLVAERFIRALKNKIYMTSISKNVYIDKLDDIVNKYNNAYHRTIKMKPVDIKPSIY